MIRKTPFIFYIFLGQLIWPYLANAADVSTGVFLNLEKLDSELIRGKSQKSDVLLSIGRPNGSGSALIPTDSRTKDIWFYEDINAKAGLNNLKMKQQILLIFFEGEYYDGFMCYSHDVEGIYEY